MRLRQKVLLIVFIVYVPINSGLARYNRIVEERFPQAILTTTRAERIPQLVEEGGFGWTGADLWADYKISNYLTKVQLLDFVPWPKAPSPKLCLLIPRETTRSNVTAEGNRIAIPTKYANLALNYLEMNNIVATPRFFSGKVEEQIRFRNADSAIDIVCSGKTARRLDLSIDEIIFDNAGLVLLKCSGGEEYGK